MDVWTNQSFQIFNILADPIKFSMLMLEDVIIK